MPGNVSDALVCVAGILGVVSLIQSRATSLVAWAVVLLAAAWLFYGR